MATPKGAGGSTHATDPHPPRGEPCRGRGRRGEFARRTRPKRAEGRTSALGARATAASAPPPPPGAPVTNKEASRHRSNVKVYYADRKHQTKTKGPVARFETGERVLGPGVCFMSERTGKGRLCVLFERTKLETCRNLHEIAFPSIVFPTNKNMFSSSERGDIRLRELKINTTHGYIVSLILLKRNCVYLQLQKVSPRGFSQDH